MQFGSLDIGCFYTFHENTGSSSSSSSAAHLLPLRALAAGL
jgi:Rps23 Pro-64 3,4-dihydroxylase Tpa1-like proline 4-hydroxylase